MKPVVAVIGPGAIGGTVAVWLDRTGRVTVVLCVRTPIDGLAVETPLGLVTASPLQLHGPQDAVPVDWVVVATKAYDTAGAAAWLGRLAGPTTRVAILQNGVEHVDRFAAYVDRDRILPVMVDIPAERDAPGRIRQRRRGAMLVPACRDGAAFAGLFDGTGIDVAETRDFTSAVWRKLCTNSAGAVSALTGEAGGVAWREPAAAVMRAIVAECILVGRAEGAILDDAVIEAVIDDARAAPRDAINSIHADRAAGRPMEWDARNGVIGRIGRRHGIATPVNDMIAGLLAAIDAARSDRG